MLPYRIPKFFIYAALILAVLAMIPPVLIARMRAVNRDLPRIQLQQDMGRQLRFSAQRPNPMFADGRAMRPKIEGTVARGEMRLDDHYYRGIVGNDWADAFPDAITVDMKLLERGRERYDIFCSICHGKAGHGDGMVHERASQLAATMRQGTSWVPPTSLHDLTVIEQPLGQIYNTITHGIRNMAAYGSQIPVEDRWAIVAYVRALQKSQDAPADVVQALENEGTSTPAEPRSELARQMTENES
jgi:mono/diheme cytochrome c family protein